MNPRTTIHKIQTLTKSEYALAKHIPNAVQLKPIEPEGEKATIPINPTPKFNVKRSQSVVTQIPRKEEVVKRSGQRYGPVEDDDLAYQLQACNERTANQEQEIEYLRGEIKKLQEERILIVQQYEQKISIFQNFETTKYELEKKIRVMENEAANMDDELKRLRMRNASLEGELEEFRRQNRNVGESSARIEELLGEISYFESQLKQAKIVQINLEQELRQRADERAKLISEYELRISNLQNDLAFLRTKKEGDSMRQSQSFNKFQEENAFLTTENKSLRIAKRDLEIQIEKLRGELMNADDSNRNRLLDAESANRNNQLLLERLKARVESNDIDKVLLMIEIERLQDALSRETLRSYEASPDRVQGFDYNGRNQGERAKKAGIAPEVDTARFDQERNALENIIRDQKAKIEELESKNILFRIEIERLGSIVAELQAENELWRQQVIDAEENSNAQIAEFKRQYELIIRPQIEAEIRNATGKLESDKGSLEYQIQSSKSKIADLENRVSSLQADLRKLQDRNLELSREVEDWKFKYNQLERNNENLKYSLEGEIRLKLDREKSELSAKWAQEKAQYEAEIARYKDRTSEIETKLILVSSEVEHLNSIIKDKDNEIEALRRQLLDMGQEQRRQLDQLREQLELTFQQRLEIEIKTRAGQLQAEKTSLESELKNAQNRINYLEDQINSLNNELQRLRQENMQKTRIIEEYNVKITVIEDREREIEGWKERYNQLQISHNKEIEQLGAYYEDTFKNRLEKELKEAGARANSDKYLLESQLRDAIAQKEALEARLNQANSEIARLQSYITEISRERDELRLKVQELQREVEKAKINVEFQIRQTIEREIIEISSKFSQERGELEGIIQRLKAQNASLQMNSILYMAEIERLHMIIFEKEGDEEMWRERLVDIENQHANHVQDLKKQFEDILRERLSIEIEQVTIQVQEEKKAIEAELRFLQTKNKELQDSFNYVSQENTRLRNELLEKDVELEKLRQRINQLSIEQEVQADEVRTNLRIQLTSEFETQLKELTSRFNNEKIALEDQIRQMKNRIAEIEAQLREAQEYNDSLGYQVRERHTEIETVKNRYAELEKNSATNMMDLQRENEKRRKAEVEESVKMAASQFQADKEGLENQIRLLQQKNQDYQQDLFILSQELEKMSKLNLELKNEIDNLRVKNANAEKRVQMEVEQIKVQLEIQYRAERDNLAKELNERFMGEVKHYESQIRDLRQKIIEYESNMTLLTNEVQRLSIVITDKNSEIEVLKGKINTLERIKEQELQELRQKFELEQRVILEKELRDIADKFARERAEWDIKHRDMRQKIIDYENKFTYLSVEVDRLNALYEEKLKEAESWKQRYMNLEHSKFSELEQVKLQIESLKRNSMQPSDYEIRFQAEKTALEAQIMQYKHKVAELEAIIIDVTKDSQRLNGLFYEKNMEAESYKKQIGSGDFVNAEEFEKLQRENNELKRNLSAIQETQVRLEVEISNYQSQVSQLKGIIEANKIEMAKSNDLLNAKKAEVDGLYHDLEKTREESNKKLRNYKEMESEYTLLMTKQRNFNNEIQDLQTARDLYRTQLEKNEIELGMKNQELIEKIYQIDVLKAKYEEAIAQVDPITSTIITRLSAT